MNILKWEKESGMGMIWMLRICVEYDGKGCMEEGDRRKKILLVFAMGF